MLKQRLIGCIVVRDGIAVQSIKFSRYLPVGSAAICAQNLDRWGIDEILLQNISATPDGTGPDIALVETVAKNCFAPLTVAGGIRSVEDVRDVLQSGADKIAINSGGIENPDLITEIATVFGRQCVVASIDAKPGLDGKFEVWTRSGSRSTGISPAELARDLAQRGAGEIMISAIHRDGTKQGYDSDLISEVAAAITVPLIVSGGVGHPRHFREGCDLPGVSAVAAANYFQFTEHSAAIAKAYLSGDGIEIRHDTYADYRGRAFDNSGRIEKTPDRDLERLVFEHYEKEKI
ncbi:MAG: imidazole glycerol phosphate synthase subunit HisF [Alphaproteobacteria bacterium]|nr:imidazole glycerol phosphate synthase subunit HisF [Alphaproteobacteria bacterium]